MEDKEMIEMDEQYIVLAVPTNSVEISITAKVWHGGKIVEVNKVMPFEELKEAFKEADVNYIPSNAVFTLTDKGREYLEQLSAEQLAKFGDI